MNPNHPSVEILDSQGPALPHDSHMHPHRPHRPSTNIILLCLILMLASIGFARFSDSTPLQKYALSALNKQESEITAVTVTAAAMSAVVALVPDDSTTPVADQVAGICSKLTYVLVVLLFERLLLSFTGLVSFGFILPMSFITFIIHQRTGKPFALKLGIRLLILGIIFYSLIPASAFISAHVNQALNLENQIENIQAEVDDMNSDSNAQTGLWNTVTGAVKDTFKGIVNGISGYLNILKHIMDVVAAMLLTDIVIPIIVLIIYKWLLQKFIEMYFLVQ